MLFATLLNFRDHLSPMQLLWINLISDLAPAIALSMEPAEPDIMEQPPRDPNEQILKNSDMKEIIQHSLLISLSSLVAYLYGHFRYKDFNKAGTLAFNSISISQLLYTLSCRSEKFGFLSNRKLPSNKSLNMAVTLSLSAQDLAKFIPGLSNLLRNAPLGIIDIGFLLVNSVTPFLIIESMKAIER